MGAAPGLGASAAPTFHTALKDTTAMTAVTSTKKATRADRIKALELAVDVVNHSTYSHPGAVTIAFAEGFAEFIATGATPETEASK